MRTGLESLALRVFFSPSPAWAWDTPFEGEFGSANWTPHLHPLGAERERDPAVQLCFCVRFRFWASACTEECGTEQAGLLWSPKMQRENAMPTRQGYHPFSPMELTQQQRKGPTAASKGCFPWGGRQNLWSRGHCMIWEKENDYTSVSLFQIELLILLLHTSQGCWGDASSSPSDRRKSTVCIVSFPC